MYVVVSGLDEIQRIGGPDTPVGDAYVNAPVWAKAVVLQAEDQDIRFAWGDGSEGDEGGLDDSTGFLLTAGAGPIRLEGEGIIRSLAFIEVSASAVLHIGFVAA
jgi:hypothetical protein